MNMWGLTPEFMGLLQDGFVEFFDKVEGDMTKSEYLLPIYIDELLQTGKVTVQVLKTRTSGSASPIRRTNPRCSRAFAQLIEQGVYRSDLFSDLKK